MTRSNPIWRSGVSYFDARLPWFSRLYRLRRDQRHFAKQRFVPTPFGFAIADDYNPIDMRPGEGEVALFQRYTDRSDVVIDVGANVGVYSCLAAQAGRVVMATEPLPINVSLLLRNLQANAYRAQVCQLR